MVVFPLVISLSILSLSADIRSLFVSALERMAEAKGAASIQKNLARAGVEARAIASSSRESDNIFPGFTGNLGNFK